MPNTYQSTRWTGIQIDQIYPVGSLYFSVNNTDPGTLFGGVWQRIEDTFLLCAGSTYAAGTTGGAASTTSGEPSNNISGSTAITVDQMPSHSHRLWSGYNDSGGEVNDGYDTLRYQQWARGNRGYNWGAVGVNYFIEHTGGGQGHTHTLSSHTHSVSTMPPYLSIYVWKRTA